MAIQPTTLVHCPKSPNGIQFPTYWLKIPNISSFWICTSCYRDKIAPSRFANAFECVWHTPLPDEQVICNFNTGRAHQLFDYALQSGDLTPFTNFAHKRTLVPICPGSSGATPNQGIRWYGLEDIPDFMACEACYEDFISVRAFNEFFRPYERRQQPEEIWACDLASPFVQRCLEQYSPSRDWLSFINAAKYRLSLEPCTGEKVSVKNQNWYIPTRLPQMMICETCFLDEILLLPGGIADNFSDYDPRQDPPNKMASCAFGKFSVQLATNRYLGRDFEKWLQVMHHITTLPSCGKEVHNEDFYMLINPYTHEQTDFGMCESCYVGCVQSTSLNYLFTRTRLPGPACCEFSPLNDRKNRSIVRLSQAIFTDNATELIDYATRAAKIHHCPRDGPNNGNCYWWGNDEFTFCAECYDVVGRESYFGPTFKYQGIFDARPEASCDMWSEYVRQAYHDACSKQDLQSFFPIVQRWRHEQRNQRGVDITNESRQETTGSPNSVTASIETAEGPQGQAYVESQTAVKGSKTAKFNKFLNGMTEVLNGINAGLEAQTQQRCSENAQYHYVAYSPQYDMDAETNVTTQSGSHSLLDIFSESMNAINAQNQAQADALAIAQAQQAQAQVDLAVTAASQQQYQAYPGSATNNGSMSHADAWNLSQKMAARHQMNMGILQTNAGMFGMHNAAMQGINNYGSSYNSAYDTTYQSHLNGYNFGQQNMTTGMAGML